MAKKRAATPSMRQADLGRRVLDTLTLGEAGARLGALLTKTPAKSVEAALQSLPKDRAQALRHLLPTATAPTQIGSKSTVAPKPTDAPKLTDAPNTTDALKPTDDPKPSAKQTRDGDKGGSAATGAPKPRGNARATKMRRPQTGLSRNGRLEAASQWLTTYKGKRIVRGYAKWFRVDRATALHDLQLLGVRLTRRICKACSPTRGSGRNSKSSPRRTGTSRPGWVSTESTTMRTSRTSLARRKRVSGLA